MPRSMNLTDTSTLSEHENSSDSEWLDIASSRASEDSDSVVGFDSDRELDEDRPASRHSFLSTGSSRNGEVQAWEGLLEDIPDEAPSVALPLTLSSALANADGAPDATGATGVQEDPEEEQRVKDALDQSMMSTLSSSRSNTLSGSHSSLVRSRDLRLSFPDPLTSSRDGDELLNASYEAVAPQLEPADADTAPEAAAASDSCPDPARDIDEAPAPADPGLPTTPVVPEAHSVCDLAVKPDFCIVLYGSSSAVKWTLIDKLLEKAAQGAGLVLTSRIVGLIDGYVRFLSSYDARDSRTVWVVDRTDCFDVSSFRALDGPSVAVVFLPSPVVTLPSHTMYLPVLAQSLSVTDTPFSSPADQLLEAEQYWETLNIPPSKVVPVSCYSPFVVDPYEIEHVAPKQLARALSPLFSRTTHRFSQRITSRHAWTLLAILSVVFGYAIKGSITPSATPTVATPQQTSSVFTLGPLSLPINRSTPEPSVYHTTSGSVRSSLKDLAQAVLPAPLVASTSGGQLPAATAAVHGEATTAMDAPSECACGCGLITWPGKIKGTTDLMLNPTSAAPTVQDSGRSGLALLASSHRRHSADSDKGKGKAVARANDPIYAVGSWSASSLSELLGLAYGAVADVVAKDIQEILDALDELARAIVLQTALAWEQSASTVRSLKARIHGRHERARARALELRRMGGRLIEGVQERVRGRIHRAKENARAARGDVFSLDAWSEGVSRRLARERRAKHRKARFGLRH